MKTVLIVDDEFYIRKRVCNCINWKDFGYDILEAEDGRQALDILSSRYIELAVIDISMPNMDGLKLAEEIKNRKLYTRVIILTGYDKFEYAKDAIKNDVNFYLLKPVVEEEMIEAVNKITQKIDEMDAEKKKLQQSIALQYQSEMLLKSIFFKTLFAESTAKKSSFTDSQLPDYQLHLNMHCCVVIYDILSESRFLQPMEKQLINSELESILHKTISSNFKLVVTTDIFSRGVLIINLLPDQMDFLRDTLTSAYENVWSSLNITAVFSCSKIAATSVKGIIKAYKEAETLHLMHIFNDSEQKILFFSNSSSTVVDASIQNLMRDIEQTLKSCTVSSIKEKIHALVLILKEKKVSYRDLELILNHFILVARSMCYSDPEAIDSDSTDITAHEILGRCDCLLDLEDEILMIFNAVISENSNISVTSGTQIRNKVNKLIETYYSDADLTVNFLANKLFLSPAYLSSTYKKYSGTTIMQYITRRRMEHAKNLMDKYHFTLSQIAEMVGYHDTFYFSKRFKQYFGMPPSSYKHRQ